MNSKCSRIFANIGNILVHCFKDKIYKQYNKSGKSAGMECIY